jgi:hypothetical protein
MAAVLWTNKIDSRHQITIYNLPSIGVLFLAAFNNALNYGIRRTNREGSGRQWQLITSAPLSYRSLQSTWTDGGNPQKTSEYTAFGPNRTWNLPNRKHRCLLLNRDLWLPGQCYITDTAARNTGHIKSRSMKNLLRHSNASIRTARAAQTKHKYSIQRCIYRVQADSGANSASCLMGTGGSIL